MSNKREPNMKTLKVLSLCDGISCGKMAFDRAKIKVEYHAIEINEQSRILADHNLKDIIRWKNDLRDITMQDIKKHGPFDWVIMGPTCKSVSKASNGPGLLGSSSILIDCIKVRDMVLKDNPNAKYLIENVKMKKAYYRDFCQFIGHEATLINSSLVSGQSRERYYWTNFKVTQPEDKKIMLNDILESDAHSAIGWSKSSRYKDSYGKIYSSPAEGREYYSEDRFNTNGKANTLLTGKHCKGQSTSTVVFLDGEQIARRGLTIRECARLQTIPDSFDFLVVKESKAFEVIGDGWTVNIIKHLFECGGIA